MDSTARSDNFDFLRIFAASVVFAAHQLVYTDQPDLVTIYGQNPGRIGVLIFFSISGYLVIQSWMRDPHLLRFAAKRILRIFPGVIVATLLCCFVLGPIVSVLPWKAYFAAPEFIRALRNLMPIWVEHHLPGVFESKLPHTMVNGPLWTIPFELREYFLLAALGLLGLLNQRWLMLAGTLALSVAYFLRPSAETNQLWELGLFFFWGACLWLFKPAWERRPFALLTAAAIASLGACLLQRNLLGLLLLIPVLVVTVGIRSTPILNRFSRFGDLSFGIYIYSSPIQQTVCWAYDGKVPPWQGLVWSLGLTLLFAYLSWHWVERPALGLKRRLPAFRIGGALSRIPGSAWRAPDDNEIRGASRKPPSAGTKT